MQISLAVLHYHFPLFFISGELSGLMILHHFTFLQPVTHLLTIVVVPLQRKVKTIAPQLTSNETKTDPRASTMAKPFSRGNELALLVAGTGAGAVVGAPPVVVVYSKVGKNGKKGIASWSSGMKEIMAFSPHTTFRPSRGSNVNWRYQQQK